MTRSDLVLVVYVVILSSGSLQFAILFCCSEACRFVLACFAGLGCRCIRYCLSPLLSGLVVCSAAFAVRACSPSFLGCLAGLLARITLSI